MLDSCLKCAKVSLSFSLVYFYKEMHIFMESFTIPRVLDIFFVCVCVLPILSLLRYTIFICTNTRYLGYGCKSLVVARSLTIVHVAGSAAPKLTTLPKSIRVCVHLTLYTAILQPALNPKSFRRKLSDSNLANESKFF